MLRPHAAMLAMLDNESSLPTRGMPHDGLIPTGADEVGIESPVSVLKEERSSYNEWFGFLVIQITPLMVTYLTVKKITPRITRSARA